MDHQTTSAGGKLGALEQLSALILPVRKRLLDELLAGYESATKQKKLLTQVGELTLMRAELEGHGRALQLADLACEYGKSDTVPDNWAEWHSDEPYDAHKEIITALEWAPGRGAGLSPALLTFFEQLPGEQSKDFADGMNHAMLIAPILSLLPENDYGAGLDEVTPKEIGDHAHAIVRDLLEKTMFLSGYNQEVARALTLAKQGGDFEEISQLVY